MLADINYFEFSENDARSTNKIDENIFQFCASGRKKKFSVDLFVNFLCRCAVFKKFLCFRKFIATKKN